MKSFAFALVVVAVFTQNVYTHVIRGGPCGCGCPSIPGPVVYTTVAQPSVAASLADTLSLLTVSSLLAESLPLNPTVVATVPVPVAPACAPVLSYGGCGCGSCSGCGNPTVVATVPVPVAPACAPVLSYGGCGCGGCSGCGGCGCNYIY